MKPRQLLLLIISFALSTTSFGQHYKKDGTPDMRYSENKAVYSQPSYSQPSYSSPRSTGHYKKDGTPDMRYKENKSNYSTTPKQIYTKPISTGNYNSFQYNTVPRDENGKIKRSSAARYEFMKATDYPDGRPGYVIDHIVPLYKGGCDCPSNMQWQTIEEAKQKDAWE